ncbi:Uncharacterized protein Adt_11030 [Abeliophyllum distichum]|uniref:Uncharacterized protein n=1 Tax=Abeliophyllum distichum TaxID=126358 RepID=A0ABD1ULP4_9LAMI
MPENPSCYKFKGLFKRGCYSKSQGFAGNFGSPFVTGVIEWNSGNLRANSPKRSSRRIRVTWLSKAIEKSQNILYAFLFFLEMHRGIILVPTGKGAGTSNGDALGGHSLPVFPTFVHPVCLGLIELPSELIGHGSANDWMSSLGLCVATDDDEKYWNKKRNYYSWKTHFYVEHRYISKKQYKLEQFLLGPQYFPDNFSQDQIQLKVLHGEAELRAVLADLPYYS